jgi:hypothetical protein
MKSSVARIVLSLALAFSLGAPASLANQSDAHEAAIRMCKQRYKAAIRGLKRLKSRDRKLRREQARRERRECMGLAPK